MKKYKFKKLRDGYLLLPLYHKQPEELKGKIKEAVFETINDTYYFHRRKGSAHPFSNDKKIKAFIEQITELIWDLKQSTDEAEIEYLEEEAKKANKKRLLRVEKYLRNTIQGFSPGAIRSVLSTLRKDLNRQLEKAKTIAKDFHYEYRIDSKKYGRIQRENDVIAQLRILFDGHKDLHGNDYEISFILGRIFEMCDLWPESKDPHELMRSRFRVIDKATEKSLSKRTV